MNAPREDAETLKCFCTRDSYLAQTKVNKQWQAGAVEHGCSGWSDQSLYDFGMRPGLFTSLSGVFRLFRLSQAVLDLLGLCDDRLRPSGLREDRVPAGAEFSRVSSALAFCRSGDFELPPLAILSGDADVL